MRSCGYTHQYKLLKKRWPEVDDFLFVLCRHLLDIVPDAISGIPLFHTCLINGMRTTKYLNGSTAICDDDSRLIYYFIDRTMDPIPRLLCFEVVCKSTHTVWDPLKDALDDWLIKHPLYEVLPSNQLFGAEEAHKFKRLFRNKLVGQTNIADEC